MDWIVLWNCGNAFIRLPVCLGDSLAVAGKSTPLRRDLSGRDASSGDGLAGRGGSRILWGPALLLAAELSTIEPLGPFGMSFCLYSGRWTVVGHYILRSRREYVRRSRLRRDVIRYPTTPVTERPMAPQAGSIVC
jgi:hypothetical protein